MQTGDATAAEDVVARYEEASQLYARVKEGTISRIETHFKLARYLVGEGQRYVQHFSIHTTTTTNNNNPALCVAF